MLVKLKIFIVDVSNSVWNCVFRIVNFSVIKMIYMKEKKFASLALRATYSLLFENVFSCYPQNFTLLPEHSYLWLILLTF